MFMAGISLGNFCGALGQCQMIQINPPTPQKGQFVDIQTNHKDIGLSFLSERIILAPSVTMFFAFSEGVICQPSLYF